jgi:hypothetical protein
MPHDKKARSNKNPRSEKDILRNLEPAQSTESIQEQVNNSTTTHVESTIQSNDMEVVNPESIKAS